MSKPDGFVPAVQRYSAHFDDGPHDLVVLTLGAQARPESGETPNLLDEYTATIADLVSHSTGPMTVDHARFVDEAGYLNHVVMAYWSARDRFTSWWSSPPVQDWWTHPDRCSGQLGYYAEPAPVRTDALETVLFREYVAGLAGCPVSTVAKTGESGYWGAARDRIPRSSVDRFECPANAAAAGDVPHATEGRLVRVLPNQNHCLIRSGVSWAACGPTQLASYQDNVLPKLNAGMDFLRTSPMESGCWSLRQVQVVDRYGRPTPESWVGAHFLSLDHLEAWAHNHPTHLAIYGQAQKERVKYQEGLELRTYHEVYIIEEPMPFEYQNCHPATGGLGQLAEIVV